MGLEEDIFGAKIWFEQASHDLSVARKVLALEEYYLVVFLCQQSSEKALKSLAKILDIDTGKKHFLRSLLALLPVEIARRIGTAAPGSADIDAYYLSSRYPDAFADEVAPYRAFTREQAERTLTAADKIVQISGEILTELVNSGPENWAG